MDIHSPYHESSNPLWVENGDECEESSDEESSPIPSADCRIIQSVINIHPDGTIGTKLCNEK